MKNIDLELIEKLAENMNEHSLNEISLEMGEQKLVLKKEKKTVERKEESLATKAPMSRFLKHKREEKRKSNYLPILILSAVS